MRPAIRFLSAASFVVLLLAAGAYFFLPRLIYIETAQAAERAQRFGRRIEDGFPHFESRSAVSSTNHGKTYFARTTGGPDRLLLTFYEITSPKEMGDIESLARGALAADLDVRSVRLVFHEAQVWHTTATGSWRGEEKLLKDVTISSSPAK